MKRILQLFVCSALVFAFACKKTKNETPASLSSVLTQGSWMVHYYFSDKDETASFSGYAFTFSADGTLSLRNGTLNYSGAWQEVTENGVKKLMIQVNTINFIQKLNDNWKVRSYTTTFVELGGSTVATSELHLMRL